MIVLTGTTLEPTSEGLAATWTTNAEKPELGIVLYCVLASDKTGDTSRQLGVKFLDGSQIAHFVFDFDTATQANLDGEVEVSATSVRAAFPKSAVGDLGEPFLWRSVLNVDGDDVARWPDPRGTKLYPSETT